MEESASEIYQIWDEARHHIESGNYDKAIEIYKYVLGRYGDDAVAAEHANAYLADVLLTQRRLAEAETYIKRAISYSPEKAGYRYILGFIYTTKQELDKAIPEFELAVKKEPDNGEYFRGLGWVIHQSGDKAKGLDYLQKAARLAPNNANILTDLAVAYLSSGDIDIAGYYAERAIGLDPANPVARDLLRQVLSFGKALEQLAERPARRKTRSSSYADTHFILRFKVTLKDKPDISRVIDIKENQMLSTLHKAIFKAFDRYEEHEYSFFLSNKPYDRESEFHSPGVDDGTGKLASRIRIDSIALYGGPKFLYLFDFGDEWWHEVELISVTMKNTKATYPKVVERHGKSPPQYPR